MQSSEAGTDIWSRILALVGDDRPPRDVLDIVGGAGAIFGRRSRALMQHARDKKLLACHRRLRLSELPQHLILQIDQHNDRFVVRRLRGVATNIWGHGTS